MKKIKKKKAFIGAIINTVGQVAGLIGKGIKAKKDADFQQQQYEDQQGKIYANEALQLGNALTQEANSQSYVDQMKNRISFKMGGNCKTKRIKKKKATLGSEWKEMSSLQKTNDIIGGVGGAIGGIGDLIGGLSYKPKDYTLKHSYPIVAQQTKVIKDPNTPIQPIVPQQPQMINQNPILAQAKLGCKRIKKRNTNRFK